jgi:SNF2 family DNA or RNA helicase
MQLKNGPHKLTKTTLSNWQTCDSAADLSELFAERSTSVSTSDMPQNLLPTKKVKLIHLPYVSETRRKRAKELLEKYQTCAAKVQSFLSRGLPVPSSLYLQFLSSMSRGRLFDSCGEEEASTSTSPTSQVLIPTSKIQKLLNLCQPPRILNEGLVITSDFTTTLQIIAEVFQTAGIATLQYTGKLSQKARTSVLQAFHTPLKNGKRPVLLLSKGAGGCGLNLSAQHMVIMEPAQCYAEDAQVQARICRLGQSHNVRILYLLQKDPSCQNTMDGVVWHRQGLKLLTTQHF